MVSSSRIRYWDQTFAFLPLDPSEFVMLVSDPFLIPDSLAYHI